MEDALGENGGGNYHAEYIYVLILVLMEDALGVQNL